MSDEDMHKLVECFESLGAKSKLDNPYGFTTIDGRLYP